MLVLVIGAEEEPKAPSPGLSRAEVLVLLLIVVVAGGLLLAGISHARETAAAVNCQNKLKQLGMAAHNYASAMDQLPPLVDQGDGAPTGCGLPSVFANLTPFIEATPLVFRRGWPPGYYHAHSSAEFTYEGKLDEPITLAGGMANHVNIWFLDPADGTASQLRDVPMALPDGTTGYYGTGSYAANGLVPWRTGGFSRSFPGGTENTVLFGERPQVCRTAEGEEVYNLWGLGIYGPHMPAFAVLTPADPPGLRDTGQAAPARPLPDESEPNRDILVRVRIGRQDAEAAPPDFATPVQVLRGGPCDPRLPGTPHRRWMQVVMADGSVRVFGPDTSPWVFWAACVPARPPGGP